MNRLQFVLGFVASVVLATQVGIAEGGGQGLGSAYSPMDIEACCLPDGSCIEVEPADCEGGESMGPGTICLGDFDPPNGIDDACEEEPETPPCCLPDGTCIEVTVEECVEGLGGAPQDPESNCTEPEACCLANGSCVMVDPLCCDDLGGATQGPATVCTALRACCFGDGSCSDLDPLCCVDEGGVAKAAGSACLGDMDTNGIDDACEVHEEPPVPTVSTWGLILLTLLLLTIGKVCLGRRTRAAT